MFAVPSFFGYNTTFVSTPVATAATGVGETSFTANWNAFAGAEYYLLDVSTSPSFSSFVFQDQVVLAPTTSYVVIGLTASTTYYYRLRASTDPYFDPDAAAFFDRVTAAGGTLSVTEQTATNQLVLDMKSAGIWAAMKAIYPMVGASAAACAQNLKSSSFTGTFSSGWTFASTGIQGGSGGVHMNTNFKNSDFTTYNSTSLFYYGNVGTNASGWDTGNINAVPNLRMNAPPSDTNVYFQFNSANLLSVTYNPRNGFFGMNRISSTQVNVFANNTKLTTVNESSIANLNTNNIVIGSQWSVGNPNNSDRLFKFYSLGDGLTDTQASNFYTAVQAFQTTLLRQV